MEEGSLRCDANVSVRPAGVETLGTKAEIKNLNSFRFVEKALEYEIDRQIDLIDDGGRVVQETRLWDPALGQTFPMRTKEEAHDYRYFPEPDLPPLVGVSIADRGDRVGHAGASGRATRAVRGGAVRVVPAGRRHSDAGDAGPRRLFRGNRRGGRRYQAREELAAGTGAGQDERRAHRQRRGSSFARLARRRWRVSFDSSSKGTISGSIAKDVFDKMFASGRTADDIVSSDGLTQIDDASKILTLIEGVLSRHPDVVAQYRAGKTSTLGFLVGQVMKATAGAANPKRVNELLKRQLESS